MLLNETTSLSRCSKLEFRDVANPTCTLSHTACSRFGSQSTTRPTLVQKTKDKHSDLLSRGHQRDDKQVLPPVPWSTPSLSRRNAKCERILIQPVSFRKQQRNVCEIWHQRIMASSTQRYTCKSSMPPWSASPRFVVNSCLSLQSFRILAKPSLVGTTRTCPLALPIEPSNLPTIFDCWPWRNSSGDRAQRCPKKTPSSLDDANFCHLLPSIIFVEPIVVGVTRFGSNWKFRVLVCPSHTVGDCKPRKGAFDMFQR